MVTLVHLTEYDVFICWYVKSVCGRLPSLLLLLSQYPFVTGMACHLRPHSKGIRNSSCPPLCSKWVKHYTVTEREMKTFNYSKQWFLNMIRCCVAAGFCLIYVRQIGHRSEAQRNAFYSQEPCAVFPCCNLLQLNDKLLFHCFLNERSRSSLHAACRSTDNTPRARKRSRGKASWSSFTLHWHTFI